MQSKYTAKHLSSVSQMNRANNFDLLRLIFAVVVVLEHCYDLSLQSYLSWIPRVVVISRFAVPGFFAISGYLILDSYYRSSSLSSFFKKRAKRILPAYWCALVFSLVLGTVFTSMRTLEFWKSPETWKYILANITFANFLHPSLPGLFAHNAAPAVNGALWTVKIEVMFYFLVPVIVALCRRLRPWLVLASIFALSVAYGMACERSGHPLLAKQLPGQMCYFSIGSLVYYYHSWFCKHRAWMWSAAISGYAAYVAAGWVVMGAFSTPLVVLCIGLTIPSFQGPTKYGDFSFGIYGFHFPIIQTLVALGLFQVHPLLAMALVLFSVTSIGIASWNLIERPVLVKREVRRSAVLLGSAIAPI